jgi:hypothetical protein
VTFHRISLGTQPIPPQEPVLLGLLLFAYLDERLPRGWRNDRVAGYLEDAKRSAAFSNQSQMMRSPETFFAIAVGTILRGRWPAEPFERAKVRAKLPGFYDWIVTEFCPDGVL